VLTRPAAWKAAEAAPREPAAEPALADSG